MESFLSQEKMKKSRRKSSCSRVNPRIPQLEERTENEHIKRPGGDRTKRNLEWKPNTCFAPGARIRNVETELRSWGCAAFIFSFLDSASIRHSDELIGLIKNIRCLLRLHVKSAYGLWSSFSERGDLQRNLSGRMCRMIGNFAKKSISTHAD